MTDDTNETLAKAPQDPSTGRVKPPPGPSERPGTEAEQAAHDKAPPKSGEGATPAGMRNTAFGGEREGADHDTEEAAAYRENDA